MIPSFLKMAVFRANAIFHGLFLGAVGTPCKISPLAVITGSKKRISIGAGTRVFSRACLNCDKKGFITIGKNCDIHPYARIMTYGGNIKIDDHTSLNPYSILYGHGGLEIGSRVRIAAHVVIIPGQHGIDRIDVPIMNQATEMLPVVIHDNVWIGAGAKILGGVSIHTGAVIGANAVVTHDVPENAVVAGVPARVIRLRNNLSKDRAEDS